jgi:3-oxoacyl-[acyl-carrier protein] reductase
MGSMRFENQVAIVTGAGRGIGHAIALRLASEGARVASVSRSEANAKKTADEINASRADAAKHYAVDVSDHAAVQRVGAQILEDFGKIDILVNNAGLLNAVPLAQMSVETWDEMIRTHLRGMFLCTRFVIPHMLERKSGKIINVTGTFGIVGGADFTHLSAAKAGMIGFTRALAREVGKQGIHVNAIAPAIIRTDLYNFMPESTRDEIVGAYPLGRVGEVADVVATAMFLATKDSDFFTGQTLCPTGGDVMV